MRRVDIKLIPVYFIIGGLTVSVAAYFGSQGKGLVGAFAGLFPGITVVTFIVSVMFLTPRVGMAISLISSIAVYLITAVIILRLS
jgi:uncharacterized membrane protein (GlpM family)